MKVLNCAWALTAVALLSVPPIIGVEAAETAKAMLKDAKGQDVGSVSFIQTPAGVLLQISLKGVPTGEHAFHIHAVGKCEPPSFDSAGGLHPGGTAIVIHAGKDDYTSEPAGNAGGRIICGVIGE
jgi:superoxide dismutase, Cu-Zn family